MAGNDTIAALTRTNEQEINGSASFIDPQRNAQRFFTTDL